MSSSESEWSDVDDDEESPANCLCLFCDAKYPSIEKCFVHIEETHGVSVKKIIKHLQLDFYGYVKLVNYVRVNKVSAENIKMTETSSFSSEVFLKPHLDDDMMLQYDIEELFETLENDLTSKLALEKVRADLAEEFLQRTIDDLSQCKKELACVLLGNKSSEKVEFEEDSESYFGSYAHFGIHEEMIKDKIRTESYRNFIINNPKIFENANVLDVGCGTSVLSMFAARAGAKHVVGVDFSEIAYQAMDIVKENNLDNVIRIIKGKAEDIKVDIKFDVIVSEWMGYFLLFESMMDTVLYCRDHYLKDNGCVYPDKCDLRIVALADNDLYQQKLLFWNDVYEFKMSAMKSSVIEEALIAVVNPDKVVSEPFILKQFDLMKITVPELDFSDDFILNIKKDSIINAIVGYFDTYFHQNAEKSLTFSTGPNSTPTHWKQTVFFLKEPIQAKAGDVIQGKMKCHKNKKDNRALDIKICLCKTDDDNFKYIQKYVIA